MPDKLHSSSSKQRRRQHRVEEMEEQQQHDGEEGVIVAKQLPNQDPMKFIQFKYKEFESLLSSFPAEVAICTAIDGAWGALHGALISHLSPFIPVPSQASQVFAGGPFKQARNFAVLNGANAGMNCIMKRLQGEEDVLSRMVAAFGSAAMFSWVNGMTVIGPLNATNVIGSGLAVALLHGAIFTFEKFSQPLAADLDYARTRSIPNNPGLENYEKNFKHDGEEGVIVAKQLPNQDPMKFIQFKYKEFESLLSPFPAEVAICTAIDCAWGALHGAMISHLSPLIPTPSQASQVFTGGPFILARNFVVLNGANAGLNFIMKRLQGKEDVLSRMVAAFGSAAMFSWVNGMTVIGPLNATNVIGSGLAAALLDGAIFTFEKFSQPLAADLDYARTRSIPNNPGLENYEKNFKHDGEEGVIVAKQLPNQDPMKFIQFKYKEFESLLSSFPAEVAICTAIDGAWGALHGAMISHLSPFIPVPSQASQVFAGGPFKQARNFAVLNGANAGMNCIMKRLQGEEDVLSRMVAAFGSAAMFSWVNGMTVIGPLNATNVIGSGLAVALIHGAIFTFEKFSQPLASDLDYARTRSIPNNPGLENYEKNFTQGLLTDNILPFLTDRALGNVRIPPGPRLHSSRSRQQLRQQKVEEIEQRQGKQGVTMTKPLALLLLFSFYSLGHNIHR